MVPDSNPSWFGRYRLSSRIATGGMAEVYLGRRIEEDGSRGPAVAVKRLLPHMLTDRRVVQMFLNEARITAQIQHPNVISILELGVEGPEPFIAMELLEGRSFAEVRQGAADRGQHVPLGITLRILVDACRGLDAAHRAMDEEGRPLRIVHRDFTPDNIHVGVSGTVKVIDFGIARAESIGSGTEPGTLKGKFFYMSPEMIIGQAVDHRADIFAAGVMLYEQLCGRRPFSGPSTEVVLHRIATEHPRPPTELDPSVPPALEHICLKALAREPDERFESLQLFIEAIERVGGSAELAPPEQVASYLESLFPLDSDPKRQALRRARLADPSQPSSTRLKAVAPVSLPVSEPAPQEATSVQAAPTPPPARKRRLVPVVSLLGGLLVLGLGATLVLRQGPAPAERLAKAEATPAPEARVSTLKGFGGDERATPAQLARAGALLLAAGAPSEALDVAESFVARFPQDVEAHLLAARASTELRMGRRAERAVEQATALAPKDVRPLLALAELRERQGDVSGAITALAEAYEKHPRDARVAPRYGLLLSHSGQLDQAAEVLVAWTRRTEDARALAELGFVRYRQDKLDEAATLLRRALRMEPELALAHSYLGAVLFRQANISGAERSYREADRLAPKDPRALVALCQVLAHTGRVNDVEEVKRSLEARFPEQAKTLVTGCEPAR
ncbi:serine/threonine-protein kinase [Archangium lipolyticum]|uniref:serine/threonine-protein kinase n=1 Tax=Archangium lipolyticum TaxID=2970465 RepID=UPI00214A2904|nr:serine/threonine-protein kinase [Archangium lipolyticum]